MPHPITSTRVQLLQCDLSVTYLLDHMIGWYLLTLHQHPMLILTYLLDHMMGWYLLTLHQHPMLILTYLLGQMMGWYLLTLYQKPMLPLSSIRGSHWFPYSCSITSITITLLPLKYAFSFGRDFMDMWIVFVESCYWFIHVLHGYFTTTGAIMWLPQWQWSAPEE